MRHSLSAMTFLRAMAISRLRYYSSTSLRGFLRYSSSCIKMACTGHASATAALSSQTITRSDGGAGGAGNQNWWNPKWPHALLPISLAASAGALFYELRPFHSLCDSLIDHGREGRGRTVITAKVEHRRVPDEFIDELRSFLKDDMTVDYEDRYDHGKPANSFHKAVNVPDVVVFPRSQEDVKKIVILCNRFLLCPMAELHH